MRSKSKEKTQADEVAKSGTRSNRPSLSKRSSVASGSQNTARSRGKSPTADGKATK